MEQILFYTEEIRKKQELLVYLENAGNVPQKQINNIKLEIQWLMQKIEQIRAQQPRPTYDDML